MQQLIRRGALGLAIASALNLAAPDVAHAQDRDAIHATRHFSVPAGSLGTALTHFAEQAGTRLILTSDLVAQRDSAGLQGDFSIEDGLRRLLAGSGLRGRLESDAILIEKAPADDVMAMDATTVQGEPLGATTENSGSYTTGSTNTATRLALSLRETPQSVSVVTRQKMDDQNIQNLDDVARTTTGLTYTKTGTERSTYYARGFEVTDLQFDGLPSSISEPYSLDAMSTSNMAIYDRVEIVRGANGLLQGTGNPSAAINLVRKRPTRDFRLSAELGAGSWDNYRAQLDVSGPLSDNGHLRGRAVAYYNTANSFRDAASRDNQLLYLIGEADLSDDTVLTLGFTSQQDRNDGYDWGGLNTRADGSFYPLSRSTSLAGKWAYLDKTNYNLFGDLTHYFDNDWKLTLAWNSLWSDSNFLSSYPARTTGDNFRLPISKTDYDDQQLGLDLFATGPYQLFGREHQLMLGANSRRDDFDYRIHNASNTPTVNITDFDRSQIVAPDINYGSVGRYDNTRKEQGLYAATRLSLSDPLSLIVGTRVSWSDYEISNPTSSDRYREKGRLIPYAGLVYDLDKRHSLYASYTQIYKTQSSYGEGNKLLDPIEGENYETGIKGEYFDGRLNTSLALFQADLLHMAEAIDGPRVCGPTGAGVCYREGGKVRNRGFEVEVSGMPLPDWNVSLGYTYSDPEYIGGASKGDDYNTRLPRRLLKVSTDYRLPGALSQWRVGGDVFSQSETYTSAAAYDIHQGGYTLVNLHTNYQVTRQLELQYNLNNVFDKVYYQSIPTSNNWGGLFYGEPRNFAVTARYSY
jgi:iron complex outermembrane receptor protein/outer membrane receptor for ferric coprogen and ferric-rhodotorulic acid